MSRRGLVIKRKVIPDFKYNSELFARLINVVMKSGKKALAEKIVYESCEIAASILSQDSESVLSAAISNVMPQVEVRSRRIGGATYQIPSEVREDRSISLALRWISKSALASREKSNKTYIDCLSNELVQACRKRGGAYKMREEKYKMAEANKAFSHFRV